MTKTSSARIADIACILRAGDELPEAALQQALKLAAAHGAHLSVTIATQQLATPYSPMWMSLGAALVSDLNEKAKARAENAADQARTAVRLAGVVADIAVVMDNVGEAAEVALRSARACDLIVVDQPSAPLDARAMVLEGALFRSGRPVLVATPRKPPVEEVNKATLAWDGTQHAARAAADMLSLFGALKQVDVVSVVGEKDLSQSLPGADFARHLSRKGIHANIVELSFSTGPVATQIDEHATASGSDLIVMGGYGHSRLRQFVMGGVTISMIQKAASPILMAY
jgi:nucleotide-binding universal stress UspA family protein